ncbi:hypothetical protein EIP86_004435 [Pleurotus ostreatoroseus]|nr:hypothetical protein EIP86_004435 [Pleurotus ostreatoroseus]
MFSLQDTAQDAHQVFDFVNRHPSILEFNVSFTYDEVRLRCIPKLIDGTGTWKMPSTPEELAKYWGSINNLLVDQPTLEDVENIPPEDRRPPDDIDTGAMYCRSFAFCRRPLPGVTTRSSAGSRQPRYEATALAFCITRQEDLWGEPYVIRDLAVILYILYRFFPRLEQLRIFDETLPEPEMSWYEYMHSLAEALNIFENLRHLAIGWPLDDLAWSWTKTREDSDYSILDAVCPPSIELGSGSLPTLDEYGDLPAGIGGRTLADDVCQELGIVKDDLDEEDDQLIMKAWEARNTRIVARVMRMLATRCPKLEEIEWYPHTDLDDTELELSYVRWRWTVNRGAAGPKGDIAPQLIAVGEELEYLRRTNN